MAGSATATLSKPAMQVARPGWLTAAIMLATVMQVLDTTIANVALPHMAASLGAAQDEITWVLTSYIVASAIATPLTGWVTDRFGRQRVFAGANLLTSRTRWGAGLLMLADAEGDLASLELSSTRSQLRRPQGD